MILLIDGPLGVGKSTTAEALKEVFHGNEVLVMDADSPEYRNLFYAGRKEGEGLGAFPHYDRPFCRNFCREIIEQSKQHNFVIVAMCLEGKAAKECIADYLKSEQKDVWHLILTISKDVLQRRLEIDGNKNRDVRQSLDEYGMSIQYINQFYSDGSAEIINVDKLSPNDIADKINKIIMK